jgi:hypothetical protein
MGAVYVKTERRRGRDEIDTDNDGIVRRRAL